MVHRLGHRRPHARVGIVLSSFRGSTEHDGTPLKGLAAPRAVDAQLSYAEIDAMVRRAIELGGQRRGGLDALIGPEDWVVIKPNIASCHGLGPADGPSHHPYVHGTVTDLRVVKSVISFLAEKKRGRRITIAEGSGEWQPVERSKSARGRLDHRLGRRVRRLELSRHGRRFRADATPRCGSTSWT